PPTKAQPSNAPGRPLPDRIPDGRATAPARPASRRIVIKLSERPIRGPKRSAANARPPPVRRWVRTERSMYGLMMDYPLTLSTISRLPEHLYSKREIVTRLPDKSLHRSTYGEFADRARRLARALCGLGVKNGDRVATLGWNHSHHLEAYFGIPLAG